jgi:spoIIIJ-associated protein
MRIVIDSGNYRDKRRGTLEQLAKKLANTVIKTGRSTTLEPMNPYERRIIHSTIAEIKGVTSASTGEEPNRCVVISATDPKPQRSAEGKGGRGGRGGRSGGKRDDRRGGRGGRQGGRREKPAPYQESSIREVPPAEAANQPLYGKIEL